VAWLALVLIRRCTEASGAARAFPPCRWAAGSTLIIPSRSALRHPSMPSGKQGCKLTADRPALLAGWSALAKRPERIKLLQLANHAAQIG
jgi:hypothetical protein